MVTNTQVVRKVREGKEGVFENASPGTLIIDASTIDPSDSKEMSDFGEKLGFKMADSP